VKDTPKGQFEWAEQLRKEGNTESALWEHEKLVKNYPDSEYTASSCFIIGEIYQSKGENKKAFDYYQKIVEKHPSSSLLLDTIKRQAEIAEKEIERGSGWLLFKDRKVERGDMLAIVIENHPYAEDTYKRALELGKFYLENKEYKKAKEVFSDIVMTNANTSILAEAQFYLIKTEFLSIPEVSTDIKQYDGVRKKIETYLVLYNNSVYRDEVMKIKNKLAEKEAKRYYEIASYYERAGKQDSAKYYYRILADNYLETSYGKNASEKLYNNF
jgi:outer membrane protein assembly factor BamD (BamD/ComL family)